jgi:hypothetical protein
MHTIQDAAKLNQQECTTFYVSAFLFQCWICELSLANSAQVAQQPDPAKRSFQSGQAWRGFQKVFGRASDAELPNIFNDLMQFGECDDPIAAHILHSAFPLSVEHELTGEFIGSHTPPPLPNQLGRAAALIRSTIIRLCDWLDSALHLRLLQEWHIMPDRFDPDPQKRELASLAIGHRHFDHMDQNARLHFLNHLADAALEQKNSPNWGAFRRMSSSPTPNPRPWPTEHLDVAIIRLWPLVIRYRWPAAGLLETLRKTLQPADLAPCPDPAALVHYCNHSLSLRWSQNENQAPSTLHPASLNIARRLLHAINDDGQQTTAE